jgi:hypothetical protein
MRGDDSTFDWPATLLVCVWGAMLIGAVAYFAV